MEFIVSQWGDKSTHSTFKKAKKYCIQHKLTDGEEGLLWIWGDSQKEVDAWYDKHKIEFDGEYMRLAYQNSKGVKHIFCNAYERWETFKEYFEEE